MSNTINQFIKKAKTVLDRNWNGNYTVPAHGLYPHQWNWDSGFIAIGYSHFNTKRAISEITHLFNAQWKNGMVPQIVFNRNMLGNYFPEPDFWQTERSPDAPDDALTSGITMPPVHGLAVLEIYENAHKKEDIIPFLRWIYPRLISLHRYLYRDRDPDGTGMVYIRHPWESGMDNSPTWDRIFTKFDMSSVTIPAYTRKDLAHVAGAEERPEDRDYDRFVYLVDLFRKNDYDEKMIRKDCPFLVYGPLFNSLLCASNEAIIRIADIIGESFSEAEEWVRITSEAIRTRLYHEEDGMFDYVDMNDGERIDVDTAAGFIPLFCGAATHKQAARIYEYLNSRSFCALHQGNCYTVPNYDTLKEEFDRVNYWKGPVWININWLLMKGLRRYGYHQKADSIAKDILQLPIRFGFHEYYDSFDGRGYGSNNFSWTAALFLDTAYEHYEKQGRRISVTRKRSMLWTRTVLNEHEEPADIPSESLSQDMLSTIKSIKVNYYTDRGTVDYDGIRSSHEYAEYRKLIACLRDFNLDLLTHENEKKSFWINLYNTIIVDGIIALGIKNSVKETYGFFKKICYIIGGQTFSPDDIEHGILRANARHPMCFLRQFGAGDHRKRFSVREVDPRIHFALVCGSRSCAPIQFYSPERINDDLETASLNFANSSEVIVIPEENKINISQIFKWYRTDFGNRDGILRFIEKFIVDDDKKQFIIENRDTLSIEYLYYDWNLNT
jgi:hypothetical protein